jgi:hypothetical protein
VITLTEAPETLAAALAAHGSLLDDGAVHDYVHWLCGDRFDFGDPKSTDLPKRIAASPVYLVIGDFPLESLDLAEWNLDDDLENHWDEPSHRDTPIAIRFYGEKDFSILDGTHRANARHEAGLLTIAALVGFPSADVALAWLARHSSARK